MQLAVITFNAALLHVTLAGRKIAAVDHCEARRAALPAALAASTSDVLCLQEVFNPQHRDWLIDQLRPTYPHVARHDNRRRGLTHGLLILSRHRLDDVHFTPFDAAPALTRPLVRQGVLCATLRPPGQSPVRIVNVHTTAGTFLGPQSSGIERLRARQLQQAHQLTSGALPTLLCGDLNAGPQASVANYQQLLSAGWHDPAADSDLITWDPRNPLNCDSRYRTCPPQRIDHVLLNAAAATLYQHRTCRTMLTAATVPVLPTSHGQIPLSDHHALRVDLSTAQ